MAVDPGDLDGRVALVVVLALALPATLWWAHFSGDDAAAEHGLHAAEPGRGAPIAIRGYYYAHVPMLLGIVGIAAGIHEAIAHPGEPLVPGGAAVLAGGVCLFFLGDAEFRRALSGGTVATRIMIAVTSVLTIPVGVILGGAPQLAALVVLATAGLTREEARSRQPITDPGV